MRCRRSSSRSLGLRDCRRLLSGTGTGNNGTGTGTGPTLDVGTDSGTIACDAGGAVVAALAFAIAVASRTGTGTGNNGTGTGTGPTLDVGTYTGTMSFDAAEAIFAIFTFAVGAVGTGHFDNGALLIENVSMSLRSPPLSIAALSVARPLEGAFDT